MSLARERLRTGESFGHTHSWKPGEHRTSREEGHSHPVLKPQSGWTEGAGTERHRHRLPKIPK